MGIGSNIKKFRIKIGLTQKDLADQLHFTYQAISRWENDEAEPSIDAMKEMCNIFGCTLDELLNGEKEVPTPIEHVKEEVPTPTINPTPICKCEDCGKDLYNELDINRREVSSRVRHGRHVTTNTHTICLCNQCNEERERKIKEEHEAEAKRKKASLSKRFKHALIWPIISFVAFLIGGIICFASGNAAGGVTCLIFGVLFFTFLATMILNNTFLTEMWEEVTSWGFITLPGVIVEFSIDGFIALIFIKIFLWALGIAVAIAAAILATFTCMVLSIFVYPVALARAKNNL